MDGILIAGDPGREAFNRHTIGSYGSPLEAGRAVFLLDIRGDIKPPLTPARTLPEHSPIRGLGPRWSYISRLLNTAVGRLWRQVAEHVGPSPELLWQLAVIYTQHETAIPSMTASAIWSLVSVPAIHSSGHCEWRSLSSLGKLAVVASPDKEADGFNLVCGDGASIGVSAELAKWRGAHLDSLRREIKYLAINMSTVVIERSTAFLELRPPVQHDTAPNEYFVRGGSHTVSAIPYSTELRDFVSIHLPCQNVNRDHPIIAEVLNSKYLEQPSSLQIFAKSLAPFAADPEDLQPIVDPREQIKRWHKAVAGKYIDVDWSSVASDLHPPYKVRLLDGTIIELTADLFESWAHAKDYKK